MSRHDEDEFDDEGPSKTQVKKAMLELQDLGLALIGLPQAHYDALPLDERLGDALADLRRITAHGARKRQMQYVGKLLRGYDVEPFRKALATVQESRVRDVRALREIEQWRERLIAGDDAWAAWSALKPAAATPRLQGLIRDARRERGNGANGHAFREMFRVLQAALAVPATAAD